MTIVADVDERFTHDRDYRRRMRRTLLALAQSLGYSWVEVRGPKNELFESWSVGAVSFG